LRGEEIPTRYPVSVSSLKSYTRCSKQWELERFTRPRPPKSPAAWTARGIAVHDSLLDWELSNRAIDVEEKYFEIYDETIERFKEDQPDYNLWTRTPRVKLVKTDIEKRRLDGLGQLRGYIDEAESAAWEIARDHEGLLLERRFEVNLVNLVDPEDLLPIRGAIDMVLEWPDGTRTIRDLKTGNPEWDPRQITTYGWVAQQCLGLGDVKRGDYYHSKLNREGKPYGSQGMVNLDRTTEYITKIYFDLSDSIQRKVFFPNPSLKVCQFCPVRNLCPEGK
jgi:hypothetical protein